MLTRSLLHGLLVVSLLAGATLTLSAQAAVVETTPSVTTAAPLVVPAPTPIANEGARLVRSGVSRDAAATLPAPQMTQGADRRNVAWMAVGLAALTVGLLIGGDAGSVVAITGGVIGLVGLFRYMN